MRKWIGSTAGFLALAALWVTGAHGQQPYALHVKAPELRGATEWINSAPLTIPKLRGHVVALNFWTFG